jgi:pSer/pThr/pTyr-binding forkhead associated (FHA) protein
MKPASYLVYEAERRAYPLNDSPFSIGRDANSDIIIREPAVSRSHAEVRPDAPITTAAKLSDGDRIEIGSVEITYREGRLPLGVSVVDTATTPTHVSDVMTRRPTITNPILGGGQAAPGKKKSAVWTLLLLLILIGAATWYFFGR